MKGLLFKDLCVLWKSGKAMLFFAVFYAFLASTRQGPLFPLFTVLFFTMLSITSIALDERSHWDRYSASLPCPRAHHVCEKYILSAFLSFFGAALLLVFNLLMNPSVPLSSALTSFLFYFSFGLLYACFSFPIIFKMGSEKGRIWYIIISVGFGIGFTTFFTSQDIDVSALSFVPDSAKTVFIFVIAVCILLALSMLLSVLFYEKKEL